MKNRSIIVGAVLGLILALLPNMATATIVTPVTKHFITNLHGSTAPAALGYNVFDTSESGLASLPAGVQGLVWLGQKCPTPADDTFKAAIQRMKSNPKVFGFYLSDEPHISSCPGGPAALASRASYVRTATNNTKWTFIVLSKQADVYPFRPAVTHVHLFGFDPYPCSIANPQCDLSKIKERVGWADAGGVSRWQIVPVFQTFGQENTTSHYYNLPTASQLQAMLNEWAKYAPTPVIDYSYSWGHQTSSNPTLVDSGSLQSVMKAHNT